MIGIICFILASFPTPIDLAYPSKDDAIHPAPIGIKIRRFEPYFAKGEILDLDGPFCEVVVKNNYVIGVVVFARLCPFVAPKAGQQNTYERVKFPIDGDNANEIVPILKNDPLNRLYFKKCEPVNTRLAEIYE